MNKSIKTSVKSNIIYNKEKNIFPRVFDSLIRFCLRYSVQSRLFKLKLDKVLRTSVYCWLKQNMTLTTGDSVWIQASL